MQKPVAWRAITLQLQNLPSKTRATLLTCLYGLAAGGAAVAFQLAVHGLFRLTFINLSHRSTGWFVGGTFAVIIGTSLMVGYLLTRFCREASGSGVPQVKLSYWKDFGYIPWRVVWVKFVAGVLSVGGGCSLGREGPSVQLASGLTSNLAGVLGEPKQNRRCATAAGAAAGLERPLTRRWRRSHLFWKKSLRI
jgi:CIC family chloride channel protein